MISLSLSDRRPRIMGIVNVTPDSFSGDGVMAGLGKDFVDRAVDQGLRMIEDGAEILDIGGESTRPGHTPIGADDELRRVIPVVEKLAATIGDACFISVDSSKASVAAAALDAGALIVNDVTALQGDPAMAALVARRGCPVVLMHNCSRAAAVTRDGKLGNAYQAPDMARWEDIFTTVVGDLQARLETALRAGITRERIILDPGLGFGKTVAQNLELVRLTGKLREHFGLPLLVAPSRKSFIGQTLDLPPDDRLEGTAACVAIAAFLGADILRVHDVKAMRRVARMAAAVRG
ncbi:MAG: dihydropteroate synthase [Bdellovibrionales bacterium]